MKDANCSKVVSTCSENVMPVATSYSSELISMHALRKQGKSVTVQHLFKAPSDTDLQFHSVYFCPCGNEGHMEARNIMPSGWEPENEAFCSALTRRNAC